MTESDWLRERIAELEAEVEDLSKQLGAEVATTMRLRDMLRRARVNLKAEAKWIRAEIDRELGH